MKAKSVKFILVLMAAAFVMSMMLFETAFAESAAVRKANTMTVKAKTLKVKEGQTITFQRSKAFTVKNAKGTVTFKKVSGDSRIKISKTGKVTVKNGLKGDKTYKVKTKVKAAGTKKYKAKSVTVTLKVQVAASGNKDEKEQEDDPDPVDPDPVDPQPVDPQPVDPQPVDPQPVDPQPVDPQPVAKKISHVVLLGVDGGGTFFRNAEMPNLQKIMGNGAVTYSCLASVPTNSAQCWGSMLHGVIPKYLKVTNETVVFRPFPSKSDYPSVFRVIRENMPEANLASICNWLPINIGLIEYGFGVMKDTADDDAAVTDKVCKYIENNDPTLLYVQFDQVDGTGHGHGYGSEQHIKQLETTDGYIGRIYDTLDKRSLLDSTLFIVTADHGGTPYGGHGGNTTAEKYVMFAVTGPTVKAGSFGDMNMRDVPSIILKALNLSDKQPSTWDSHVPSGIFAEES